MDSFALSSSAALAPRFPLFGRHDTCSRDRVRSIVVCVSTSGEEKVEEREKVNIKREKMSGNSRRASRTVATTLLHVDRARLMDVDSISRKSNRLMPRALLESLHDRIQARQWESAIKVFELLRLQEWYSPNEDMYVKMLVLLGNCKQPNRAAELFEKILEDKMDPSLKCCTALLSAYMKSKHLKAAFQMFENMKTFPQYQPDVCTYTLMIKGCCENNLYDQASRLLAEMQDVGVQPNYVTINMLLDAFGHAGMLSQMEELFLYSQKADISSPNIYGWNIMIKHCGNNGDIKRMEKWFEDLQAAGRQPDKITLNTLLYCYGRNGLYDKMRSVVAYMRKYLYGIDHVAYNSMIEAYGRGGMMAEMESAFAAMKRSGTKFTAYTLCCLLRTYAQENNWEGVQKVRKQWLNSGVVPDVALYNALLHAYRRAGNISDMEAAFLEMKNGNLRPDEITYTILISAYKYQNMEDRIDQLQREMKSLRPQTGQI